MASNGEGWEKYDVSVRGVWVGGVVARNAMEALRLARAVYGPLAVAFWAGK